MFRVRDLVNTTTTTYCPKPCTRAPRPAPRRSSGALAPHAAPGARSVCRWSPHSGCGHDRRPGVLTSSPPACRRRTPSGPHHPRLTTGLPTLIRAMLLCIGRRCHRCCAAWRPAGKQRRVSSGGGSIAVVGSTAAPGGRGAPMATVATGLVRSGVGGLVLSRGHFRRLRLCLSLCLSLCLPLHLHRRLRLCHLLRLLRSASCSAASAASSCAQASEGLWSRPQDRHRSAAWAG